MFFKMLRRTYSRAPVVPVRTDWQACSTGTLGRTSEWVKQISQSVVLLLKTATICCGFVTYLGGAMWITLWKTVGPSQTAQVP